MKIKVITALISAFSLLAVSLSSCGYEISIKKKGEAEETTAAPSVINPVNPTVPSVPVPEIPVPSEVVPEIPTVPGNPDISVDNTYQLMPMAESDVLELYRRAVNDVKIRCPGYVRDQHQDITDVESGKSGTNHMQKILEILCEDILEDSGDKEKSIKIMAHDDVAVRETFPVFDKEAGCEMTDMSIVRSAGCYTDGNSYKISIVFNDQLNPEPYMSEFGKIMTPVDGSNCTGQIAGLKRALGLNTHNFNINYKNCEIECIIDKASSRMVSLKQKMVMEVSLTMYQEFFLFQTRNTEAGGTVINRLEYSEFDWT